MQNSCNFPTAEHEGFYEIRYFKKLNVVITQNAPSAFIIPHKSYLVCYCKMYKEVGFLEKGEIFMSPCDTNSKSTLYL